VTVNPQGPLIIDDSELVVQAALKGMGIGTALENSISALIAEKRLVQVLQDWRPSFPGFYLYYPSRRNRPQRCRNLSEQYGLRVRGGRSAFVNGPGAGECHGASSTSRLWIAYLG
jgi:DNA-binding transcriptional LysR family regulator